MLAHFFDGFFGFLIFLMVFGSAGLVPSYLRKGRVELNLSKPVGRPLLISLRFVSVYLVMTVILIVVATLVWLTIGMRSGFFMWRYFYGLGLAAFQFLIIYAIVFFLGIMTHSAAAGIMGYFMLRIAAGLLAGRAVIYPLLGDSIWKTILDSLYHVLPKIGETSANFLSLLGGQGLGDLYPLWSSLLFALALFVLALWIFQRRDY
jgi:ABC-type transport system involved in multi-copper enzyme maturation permease subunit